MTLKKRSTRRRSPSEAQTRQDLIDPALGRAGWDVKDRKQVGVEMPTDGSDPIALQQTLARLNQIREEHGIYEVKLPPGISDYALYRANGEIIAVVEAKKTSIDPRLAQTQANFYITEIAKRQSFTPFAFMTNGKDIRFWEHGGAPVRLVSGFFSRDDLENLLYLRQNRMPLTEVAINAKIVDRAYQHEAVRRVSEAFEAGKRKALLVMATGTGKTRTSMALVDLFLRANQARRILFVADRDALVRQALNDGFRTHLPDEPCTRIHTKHIDTTNRLYVVTLQTLNLCMQEFTPAFFDLIIFDEVHRSIFNQWKEVLEYFDARMIGLTATPADFINRNTFLSFECDDDIPTFLYSQSQAIADEYLVDYNIYVAKTKFQRTGIKGVDLTEEERNTLIEQGIDPDDLDFSNTDLEKTVSNTDTLRRQWQEIWEQALPDASGQLPGKTIVFAMTQAHALRLRDTFNEMFPKFNNLVEVITSNSDYKGQLLERFKKENFPRIAITVNLLDTGIDVPEVVNLVFMKPVQSRIKLEQMIGRGTRSHAACKVFEWLPNGEKTGFKVIDFWENDFQRTASEELRQSMPVLVSLFNNQLRLLELELRDQQGEQAQRLIEALRDKIEQIPLESFLVKQVFDGVQVAWEDHFWNYLTEQKITLLRQHVAPLLRLVPAVDVPATTFINKVERFRLQLLQGRNTNALLESIRTDVSRLPPFVSEDPTCKEMIAFCLSYRLESPSMTDLNRVIDTLAPHMSSMRKTERNPLLVDLSDVIELRGYVLLKGGSERVYVSEYKKLVEQRILDMIDSHPAIAALASNEPLTDAQLIALERTLRRELAGNEMEMNL
ncbi:MAG: DEAD/DEAH box helicase family protein, partial [Chloroflexota bacterium]